MALLSLHRKPEPRLSRKGWSGSGCYVAIFYCQIQHRTLKIERPSAWIHGDDPTRAALTTAPTGEARRKCWRSAPIFASKRTARRKNWLSTRGEPENAAGRGHEIHAGRTAHPTSCVQNEHMRLFSLVCIRVDKLSTWILFVLRLTST